MEFFLDFMKRFFLSDNFFLSLKRDNLHVRDVSSGRGIFSGFSVTAVEPNKMVVEGIFG